MDNGNASCDPTTHTSSTHSAPNGDERTMRRWTPAEAESYLKYTLAIAAERTHGTLGWGVDLTHLRDVYGELLPEDVLIA